MRMLLRQLFILSEILIIYLANSILMEATLLLEHQQCKRICAFKLYMPFYWLFRLLDPSLNVVPKITYLQHCAAFFMIHISICYIMGYKVKAIDKDLTEIKNKMFYRGEKKK